MSIGIILNSECNHWRFVKCDSSILSIRKQMYLNWRCLMSAYFSNFKAWNIFLCGALTPKNKSSLVRRPAQGHQHHRGPRSRHGRRVSSGGRTLLCAHGLLGARIRRRQWSSACSSCVLAATAMHPPHACEAATSRSVDNQVSFQKTKNKHHVGTSNSWHFGQLCIDKENCWDSSVILFPRTASNKRNFGLITPLPLTFFSSLNQNGMLHRG
jgi:hypothetical protein